MPKGQIQGIRLYLDKDQAQLLFGLLKDHYSDHKDTEDFGEMRELARVIGLMERIQEGYDKAFMAIPKATTKPADEE